MSYDNYKTARDMAWKILLECGIDALPVRPSVICDHYGNMRYRLVDSMGSVCIAGQIHV